MHSIYVRLLGSSELCVTVVLRPKLVFACYVKFKWQIPHYDGFHTVYLHQVARALSRRRSLIYSPLEVDK